MNQTKKVVHVNLAKSFRGGEIQTFELIKALHACGLQQEAVCRKNSPLAERLMALSYVQVTQVSGPLSGHLSGRDARFHAIVHAHEARAVYWAWIENLLRHTPYVITRRVINSLGQSWATKKAYQGATALAAVSSYAASVLAQSVQRNVHVVMDACRQFPVGNASQPISDRWPGSPRIGHVGEIDDAVKGQGLLIKAFLRVLRFYPEARLFLIGEGKDRTILMDQCKDQDRIVFVGAVNNVNEWLRQLDVFCFPSHIEALGSSVLEAMDAGVPVVVSNTGGLPELVGNQERGLLVSEKTVEAWSKAIIEVLEKPEETKVRAESAKAFVLQNNATSMAQKYLEIYRTLWSQRLELS